jgi:hypothetical protein
MRSWLYMICLFLVAAPSSTQSIELKAVGAVLGGSWMSQEYEFTPDYEFSSPADNGIPGFVVGAFSSVALGHQFSAYLEALYIRKGFESTFLATDENGLLLGEQTEVYAADYLSVPVTVRFEVESNAIKPYCYAGLGAEILLSGGDSGYFDSFNSVTLSGHFGVGLAWQRFGVDLRYLRDLTSAADPAYSLESVTNDGFVAAVTFAIWE